MALRSFRSRLLLGSLLTALGLLAVAHMLSLALVHHFPLVLRVPHVEVIFIALLFIAVGVSQVRGGLTPLERLRVRLTAVREGKATRIDGTYPSEVGPLVSDLNALLEHREETVRRAVARAGDLAHGLKTPLAVLAHDAEIAEAGGHLEVAASIRQQVERMGRQIDYHLAQARASASGATPGAHTSVRESADGLARTLLRLNAERGLTIEVNVSPDLLVRGERQDLDEILGNLLDNACKWARQRAVIAAASDQGIVSITVDDDGPGLDPSMRAAVFQRGVRADEEVGGSGLGLAIVRELVELYGGSISLTASPLGGCRVAIRLPAA